MQMKCSFSEGFVEYPLSSCSSFSGSVSIRVRDGNVLIFEKMMRKKEKQKKEWNLRERLYVNLLFGTFRWSNDGSQMIGQVWFMPFQICTEQK